MQKQLKAVKLFHETYGLGVSEEMKADLGALKNELRFNLMKEENEEYLEAVQNNDIVEGSIISHETYGTGVVVKDEGSLISVAFKTGIRKLMKNHKSIKKI